MRESTCTLGLPNRVSHAKKMTYRKLFKSRRRYRQLASASSSPRTDYCSEASYELEARLAGPSNAPALNYFDFSFEEESLEIWLYTFEFLYFLSLEHVDMSTCQQLSFWSQGLMSLCWLPISLPWDLEVASRYIHIIQDVPLGALQ